MSSLHVKVNVNVWAWETIPALTLLYCVLMLAIFRWLFLVISWIFFYFMIWIVPSFSGWSLSFKNTWDAKKTPTLVDYLRDGLKTSLPAKTLSYAKEDTHWEIVGSSIVFFFDSLFGLCWAFAGERERWWERCGFSLQYHQEGQRNFPLSLYLSLAVAIGYVN